MEIAAGIYDLVAAKGAYRKAAYSKATLVDSDDGLIVIDTLYDEDAKDILAQIARIGRSVEDIKHIVLTHAHRGHLGGVARLKGMSGAPVYSHAWEADIVAGDRRVQEPGLWTFDPIQSWPVVFIGQVLSSFTGFVGCPVDVLIEDGDQIGPFQVIGTPGHTPGHLVFYWPERKTLISGDAFVTWPRVCPGWPNTNLNAPQAWDSLEIMSKLDVEVISPGHGDPITSDGGEVMRQLLASRHK